MIFSPIGRTDADGNTLTILLLLKTIGPDCNSNLQDLVNYIDNWTTRNNMKLNIGKCKELVDFAKKKHCFPPLTVDEVNIERVKSARILGLTVQDNMKWNEHIHNIV